MKVFDEKIDKRRPKPTKPIKPPKIPKGKCVSFRPTWEDHERMTLVAKNLGLIKDGEFPVTEVLQHCIRYRVLEMLEPTIPGL